jgi:hypothetical protein
MYYGNNGNGYSYSPDRRNDRVNHYSYSSQFINANGSRQTGYYASNYSSYNYNSKPATGWYDGAGRYHEN